MDTLEQRLKRYALYLLGRRAYSVGEMREKLNQKNNKVEKYKNTSSSNDLVIQSGSASLTTGSAKDPGLMIENVIAYLTNLNLLDDNTYAKTLVESLLRQNKSKRYIENKLRTKKIGKEVIESVLIGDAEKESDSLTKLITSKLRHSPALLSTPKGKAKLVRFLLYRGFSYGDVKKALELIS